MNKTFGVLSWLVVAAVGVFVVALVVQLSLFGRLHAAQDVLDGLSPAFTTQRIAGDRAGVKVLHTAVKTVDPIINKQGGASDEVEPLINYAANVVHVAPGAVVRLLQHKFPKTTGLLLALPLTRVSAEIPKLVDFLSKNLNMTHNQVLATLQQNFPNLAQVLVNLPTATSNWGNIRGAGGLTRFNGANVSTIPQFRDYASQDVVPLLQHQQAHFHGLASHGGVGYIPTVLLLIAAIAIFAGVAMMVLTWVLGGKKDGIFLYGWFLVEIVGLVVLGLVFALNLYPRLSGGQKLLDAARPAFTQQRVAGTVAAINKVDKVVKAFDPAIFPSSGASAEVPKLAQFLQGKLHMSKHQLVATLHKNFPHTLSLLRALPLSGVNAEIHGTSGSQGLFPFLSGVLHMSQAQVHAKLRTSFPKINQAVVNLPILLRHWNDVPGTAALTRFNGRTRVRTVPEMVTYLKNDVVHAVDRQAANFRLVDTTWPRLTVFPPLLVVIALIVMVYALLMIIISLARKK